MKIITETGSQYIIENGLCKKTDSYGNHVDVFKLWSMKPVPNVDVTLADILDIPDGKPIIGARLYVSGKNTWWVSTKIVAIEE